MPSEFDSNLAFTLGNGAAALVAAGASGYMATAHCLAAPVAEWRLAGVPLYVPPPAHSSRRCTFCRPN